MPRETFPPLPWSWTALGSPGRQRRGKTGWERAWGGGRAQRSAKTKKEGLNKNGAALPACTATPGARGEGLGDARDKDQLSCHAHVAPERPCALGTGCNTHPFGYWRRQPLAWAGKGVGLGCQVGLSRGSAGVVSLCDSASAHARACAQRACNRACGRVLENTCRPQRPMRRKSGWCGCAQGRGQALT